MANREVTKEEFFDFIGNYPNPLVRDVAMMFDPPLLNYNDFSGDKVWPESVVAFAHLNDSDDESIKNNFFIKE